MSSRILPMLAVVALPVLAGSLRHASREGRLARSDTATGRFLSRAIAATYFLIGAWMLFGIGGVFLSRPSSPWVVAVGVVGLLFGSLFGLTVSLLEWHASRPKPPGKAARRLGSMGAIWDAELDR